MRNYDLPDLPDLPDTPPDDDEPAEGVRVTCWNCGGEGRTGDGEDPCRYRCEACGGTGYTHETTEDEEAEDEA